MDARPIPVLGTHSAFTEIVTAMVGRWQHFVRADSARKANPVLLRTVTVATNGSNYVTLCILFFADIIVRPATRSKCIGGPKIFYGGSNYLYRYHVLVTNFL